MEDTDYNDATIRYIEEKIKQLFKNDKINSENIQKLIENDMILQENIQKLVENDKIHSENIIYLFKSTNSYRMMNNSYKMMK